MFANLSSQDKAWRQNLDARGAQRQRVLWLQDQITLAVFHQRPDYEIQELMEQLAITVSLQYSPKRKH